jgi:hypothetical protein
MLSSYTLHTYTQAPNSLGTCACAGLTVCMCVHLQVTAEHNEDCKKLLRLMGVPVIDAPSEAEAQCAAMAKAGVVYGAATEDMDCLTFGCPRLIRHLMASQVGSTAAADMRTGDPVLAPPSNVAILLACNMHTCHACRRM